MPFENGKKEKLLALLIVVLLFFFISILLFSISLNNKNRTEALKKAVEKIQLDREVKEKLDKIHLIATTSPEVTAKSYLTLALNSNGEGKILAVKEADLSLPIASVTKLMVAVVTLENLRLDTDVTATRDYIGREESAFVLETNKVYKVQDLLANALISSDNDSARLLSSTLGENNFIAKMNSKAKSLGMASTTFFSPTGLDPTGLPGGTLGVNVSTATDLAKLLLYIKNHHPEIFRITTNSVFNFCDISNYCKVVTNTDKLLQEKGLKYDIIGGKTGSTDLALKNLVLLTDMGNNVTLINVVLGARDSFVDTTSLINNVIMDK